MKVLYRSLALLMTVLILFGSLAVGVSASDETGYSKKFRTEHESEILLHQAAKKAFDELGLKKLPTVKSLRSEYAELLAEKKKMYTEYRKARDDMRELFIHKANVDMLLGKEDRSAQRDREHGPGR